MKFRMFISPYKGTVRLVLVAILTLILFRLLPYGSTLVEYGFSRGLFRFFRSIWDYSLGLLPFGFIYILLTVVLYYWLRSFYQPLLKRQKWLLLGRRMIQVISIGIISFYWLWGFNYKRYAFRDVVNLREVAPSEQFIFDEYCSVTDSLIVLHNIIGAKDWTEYAPSESEIRDDLRALLDYLSLPNNGRVRVRKIRPKGSLLYISTAGVYLPFTGEGHIDAGLHPITHPFTMMHEMAHGYGWTGEDVCNFMALLGCANSSSVVFRYSGYMAYWRYLRAQMFQIDQERFDSYYRDIPTGVKEDYMEILEYSRRYPDIMPQLRDLFYDQYLRSHGIPSGLINYSQMILLTHDWQLAKGSLSIDSISKVEAKNIAN